MICDPGLGSGRVPEHHMLIRTLVFLLALTAALPVCGQFSYPASASHAIGFAQLADGGPANQRWKTTLTFTNPDTTLMTEVNVYFYGNNGQPISIDFGSGPVSTLFLMVPAGGTKSVTSMGNYSSTAFITGWALAQAGLPVTGTVLYQASTNGTASWDVAAVGAGATYFYSSYANVDLGYALANPNTQPINLRIDARDSNGLSQGSYTVPTLPAHGHTSGNLKNVIDFSGSPSFTGTITVTPLDEPPLPFGAWTLNVRDGLLSPLPPGEMVAPGPHNRRPYDIARMVQKAGPAVLQAEYALLGQPNPNAVDLILRGLIFVVDTDAGIKASCRMVSYTPEVHISTGMIEALGASDAALAFVIAHMSMHGVYTALAQKQSGACSYAPSGPYAGDPEGLSDAAAVATLLQAGFDPAGAADFYSHMIYANEQGLPVDTALKLEFGIPNSASARIQAIAQTIGAGCSGGGAFGQICETARKYWHPHNPAGIP
jgi:hypothetical protein